MLNINWRYHDASHKWVRLWRDGWAGDQFEVVNFESLQSMQTLTRGTVQFTEHDDSED